VIDLLDRGLQARTRHTPSLPSAGQGVGLTPQGAPDSRLPMNVVPEFLPPPT